MKSLSRVRLFVTPWIVAYQAPLSMGFSRQEHWRGLPFPSPRDLPDPGIEPGSPALQTDTLPSEPPGKPLLACEMSATVQYFEHFLALLFFGIGMKTDHLFQSCGHCWVFQIWWHIEGSTFTALSFRIWNSSAGIPSSPLVLFKVTLPKAYLTSHC